ncbi:embryogenesis-associated protein emb8 [Quercus suber]|uniref:Embryogenesis-associated protein emb8 n=1 Tax=Quercus suber TaxID=58331 RepID=A0AAW0LXC4_QUESU
MTLSAAAASTNSLLLFSKRHFQVREFRVFRRRRLKQTTRSSLLRCSQFEFEGLFQSLVSQFPSVNSLEFISPALGFAAGFALHRHSSKDRPRIRGDSDVGEWILFTSPTPFNRFVFLRCPSVSFAGGEDVNERLVKEDRHFVRLNKGRIVVSSEIESCSLELEFQRVCVSTEDGGVVSLDWPANLDLEKEHGLDTTLLLIPGSPQGSLDNNVRSFVAESLSRGCFPVVMNPRGCAGSPLTTARLFTAADSDDISTAIQFINKARPWTTLMAVGWEYGANMLTKYLAEAGENTPLTAATCIDNPFDLEEATRSSPYHMAIDQKLTGGLIDILRSNKELFQGKAKGFDVEKALLAKSVRDFEKAISMVSYGFEVLEDFYSESSTREVVGNVKIPVLFIQWLTAVELGLLKGRHPLLKDVDVTINPSKGLTLVESRSSDKNDEVDKLSGLTQPNALNGYSVDPIKGMLEDSDTVASLCLSSRQDSQENLEAEDAGLQEMENGALQKISSVDSELVKEEEVSSVDGERGQGLQTAQVVMNMLDVTMPGTLTEEKKQKVLTAVDQGETLVKALQDAVPEDVREKLTTAVTGILHTQGTNLNFNGLLDIARIPDVSTGLKAKIQEKVEISGGEALNTDHLSSDQIKRADELTDSLNDTQPGVDKPTGDLESDLSQSTSGDGVYISGSVKDTSESGNNDEYDESSKEKSATYLDNGEIGSETDVKPTINEKKDQDGGIAQIEEKEENNNQETGDSSTDQDKVASSSITEEVTPGTSSDADAMGNEGNDNLKRDNKSMQPVQDQTNSIMSDPSPSTFNVSQAFDALTGMDDSTQVAVNTVFGVLENMITQLEEGSDDENGDKDRNDIKEKKTDSGSDQHSIIDDHKLDEEEENENVQSIRSDNFDASFVDNRHENSIHSQHDTRTGRVEEETSQNLNSSNGKSMDRSQGSKTNIRVAQYKNEKKDQLVGSKLLADNPDKIRHVNSIPLHITANPYGTSLYTEYLRKYLLSKKHTKSLDVDATTSLLLDYFPEEGQWKLLEQPGNTGISTGDIATHYGVESQVEARSCAKAKDTNNFIEPSYVIFDTEKQPEPVAEYETMDHINGKVEISDDRLEELMHFVKNIVINSLKVEVGRRLSAADMKEIILARELELVANAVSLAVGHDKEHIQLVDGKHSIQCTSEKLGTLQGELIIRAISSAVKDTNYLRKVLPIGVIIGSILAALRKSFNVATVHDNSKREVLTTHVQAKKSGEITHGKVSVVETDRMPFNKSGHSTNLDTSVTREGGKDKNSSNNTVMVGAVTAALGASALLVKQQDFYKGNENSGTLSKSSNVKGNYQREPDKLEEAVSENDQNNIVTSLAEKAMSVAGPVVPMKEDGGVDQERLVALLADLGQKGGLLKLFGKLALLWGGIRGAVSLTNRLLLFLRLAERPLFQRILGFVGMVFVLWSPVVIPLLPTLMQSWMTNTPSRIAELVCVIGLYTATTILVMLWGKRIRGYEDALQQYGLDLTSLQKIQNFLKGLIGGVVLVLSIHSLNALIGCVSLSWPSTPSHLDAMTRFKVYGRMLMLAGQGIVTATGVAFVEELVFRSWLPKEIEVDLGYHQGIIISGLAFALFQRSPQVIPGLWLLSLGLAGAYQRSEGSLSIPIGLRAGIVASSFVLQKGGLLTYKSNFPLWVTGAHPFQPFSGVVGFAFALVMATVLYPTQPPRNKKLQRTIRE